jgi:hypothetical protein
LRARNLGTAPTNTLQQNYLLRKQCSQEISRNGLPRKSLKLKLKLSLSLSLSLSLQGSLHELILGRREMN